MKLLADIYHAFTARERAAFAVAAAFAISSGVALGGMMLDRATKVVPRAGGEYAEGFVGQPVFANPALAESDVDRALVRLLFAPLPDLAEKIEIKDAGKTVRVRLKENLRWSDGAKLTSDDVVFTVRTLQDPAARSPLAAAWKGAEAGRLSEIEFQLTLRSGGPFTDDLLKNLFPVPKHIFADVPLANWRISDYILKAVGSGPYLFRLYEKESSGFITSYRLEANENALARKPLIGAVTFLFLKSEEELLRAFQAGTIDGFATSDPALALAVLRPHQEVAFPLPAYYAVFLNQNQHLALKESAVREALSRTAPREKIAAEALGGGGAAVWGPLVPGTPYGESAAEESLDAAAAGALLDGAGWKAGEDGVRVKSVKRTPIRLAFTLTVPDLPFLVQSAEILRDAWRDIGAEIELRRVPAGDDIGAVVARRDYQAVLFGNVLTPPGDLYPFWHSSERFTPGMNLALYSKKDADALMESVRADTGEDRSALALKAQNIAAMIQADHPAVFLFSPVHYYIGDKQVKGVLPRLLPDIADRFRDLRSWYLRTTREIQ